MPRYLLLLDLLDFFLNVFDVDPRIDELSHSVPRLFLCFILELLDLFQLLLDISLPGPRPARSPVLLVLAGFTVEVDREDRQENVDNDRLLYEEYDLPKLNVMVIFEGRVRVLLYRCIFLLLKRLMDLCDSVLVEIEEAID